MLTNLLDLESIILKNSMFLRVATEMCFKGGVPFINLTRQYVSLGNCTLTPNFLDLGLTFKLRAVHSTKNAPLSWDRRFYSDLNHLESSITFYPISYRVQFQLDDLYGKVFSSSGIPLYSSTPSPSSPSFEQSQLLEDSMINYNNSTEKAAVYFLQKAAYAKCFNWEKIGYESFCSSPTPTSLGVLRDIATIIAAFAAASRYRHGTAFCEEGLILELIQEGLTMRCGLALILASGIPGMKELAAELLRFAVEVGMGGIAGQLNGMFVSRGWTVPKSVREKLPRISQSATPRAPDVDSHQFTA